MDEELPILMRFAHQGWRTRRHGSGAAGWGTRGEVDDDVLAHTADMGDALAGQSGGHLVGRGFEGLLIGGEPGGADGVATDSAIDAVGDGLDFGEFGHALLRIEDDGRGAECARPICGDFFAGVRANRRIIETRLSLAEVSMLRGRRAVVTGSTSGIGAAIARALAAEGCALMLHGLGELEEIERQRAELATIFGVEVLYNGARVEDADACAGLVKDAETRLGGVDILVNNAGTQFVAPVEKFPAAQWDNILAVNLSAAFHTIRTALPGMRAQGWGRIVNTASVHGLVASVNKAAYVASKHGLVGLTKVVALEAAGSGVTCNAICPGWVRTGLVERQIAARAQTEGMALHEAERRLLAEKQPSGVFTTAEEIAALTLFLCSEAASNVTGACWPMDGGWTAQ